MAYLNDNVFDSGLAYAVSNGDRIDLCSAEPANYAGIAAVSIGFKAGLTVGSPQSGATDGRRVIVPAITDGEVTVTDEATHWALSDGSAILVAAGPLSAPQEFTDGNVFTLDAISITLRDATAV